MFQGIPKSRPVPSTNLAFEEPADTIQRKRREMGIPSQAGVYQPNGPSIQDSPAGRQPQPNPQGVDNTQRPPSNVTAESGGLYNQLATLPTANVNPQPHQNPENYRAPNIPGTWQSLGNNVAHTREEANNGWQKQTESPLWSQLGGASFLPAEVNVSVDEGDGIPTGTEDGRSDAQQRLASHVAVAERQAELQGTRPVDGRAATNGEFGGNLTYDPNLGKASSSSQSQPDQSAAGNVAKAIQTAQNASGASGVGTQTSALALPPAPQAPWVPNNVPSDNPAALALWYTQNWDDVAKGLIAIGMDEETVGMLKSLLTTGQWYIAEDGSIYDTSEMEGALNGGKGGFDAEEGNIHTPLEGWDQDLQDAVNLGTKYKPNEQTKPTEQQDPEEEAFKQAIADLLKFGNDSRGVGQISQESIDQEINSQRQQRMLEQGQGLWAALEYASNTGASPEATQGVIADISQRGAIQGQALEAQTRMQREYYNAQREAQWAQEQARNLALAASFAKDDATREDLQREAKNMLELQSKLGIKMMYIQDQLNTPSAGEVVGSIFANAAQALPGIGLAYGLSRLG